MALGLFDVVGPVMHGPSSNHTGGANRIGFCIRKLMGGCPEAITLLFHPAYMSSYRGQASHTALIAGCLGYREYDAESTGSLEMAEKLGIPWSAAPYPQAKSRNLMGVRASVDGEMYEVIGDSVGGGSILIQSVNGVPVHLTGNEYVAMFYTREAFILERLLQASLLASDAVKRHEDAQALAEVHASGSNTHISNGSGSDEPYAVCSGSKIHVSHGSGSDEPYAVCSGSKIHVSHGHGSDGRYVVCFSSPDEIHPLEICPEIEGWIQTGLVRLAQLEPLEIFRDKNKTPLCKTFEEACSLLGPDEDLSELAIRYEMDRSEVSREQVLGQAAFIVEVIKDALKKGETEEPELLAGLADPKDGKKLLRYADAGHTLVSPLFAKAMARAMIMGERNAGACRIVACPTGGAAGTLPAVILTTGEQLGCKDDALVRAFLVAALTGVIIGNKASFSGTVGGCQAEVGIGAAMGAAAVTWLAGGSTDQVIQAACLTTKNLLGLSCDPPAPCTEVPCIKRNAMGVAAVYFGSELALAGIRSAIDPDDVISALADTQKRLPVDIKFGGRGGLAGTPSGQALRARWESQN